MKLKMNKLETLFKKISKDLKLVGVRVQDPYKALKNQVYTNQVKVWANIGSYELRGRIIACWRQKNGIENVHYDFDFGVEDEYYEMVMPLLKPEFRLKVKTRILKGKKK